MSGIFLLVETLNKESVVGEHQCPVLAGLGCILIVIMFVSQIMPLFEGHSANKAGSTDIYLFVYLGLGFGNVLGINWCVSYKPSPLACNWTTLKSAVKNAVKPQNSAL